MKLFYSPIHGFIHKVLVVAHEAGVIDTLEFVPTWPLRPEHDITAVNPVNKVPTLTLDDGTAYYGSQTIAEFFDFIGKGGLFPPAGDARWDTVRRLALADQAFEVNVQITMDKTETGRATYEWGWKKLMAVFDQMERDAADYSGFDVGHASNLQTISYFDRSCKQGYPVFQTETYDWTVGRPKLAAWYAQAIQRPSVQWHFNKDYTGDVSAENVARAVAEVVALRNGL